MRAIQFEPHAFRGFVNWRKADPSIFKKLTVLIKETARNPFEGKGKPEPLKNELKGYWSRRITQKHRLVYRVKNEVIACQYHYSS